MLRTMSNPNTRLTDFELIRSKGMQFASFDLTRPLYQRRGRAAIHARENIWVVLGGGCSDFLSTTTTTTKATWLRWTALLHSARGLKQEILVSLHRHAGFHQDHNSHNTFNVARKSSFATKNDHKTTCTRMGGVIRFGLFRSAISQAKFTDQEKRKTLLTKEGFWLIRGNTTRGNHKRTVTYPWRYLQQNVGEETERVKIAEAKMKLESFVWRRFLLFTVCRAIVWQTLLIGAWGNKNWVYLVAKHSQRIKFS